MTFIEKINKQLLPQPNSEYKILDLFAGCGGLSLGFEAVGFHSAGYEMDVKAAETYNHNLKGHCFAQKLSIDTIYENNFDVVIGGPPCQSWSEAGSKKGIADKRGQLFYEFMRILADKKPKFFLAENVSGMLLPAHKEALANIKQMFTDIGYDL